jgi:uncharacterized LabA/DUF88 family protein
MSRRLNAYEQQGVYVFPIPLRYDRVSGRYREKGVDVRIALDLLRLGRNGYFDVAIIASEDSDIGEAAKDLYELRDHERWIAVENVFPWGPRSHSRWLPLFGDGGS